jgi:hypothetical protein
MMTCECKCCHPDGSSNTCTKYECAFHVTNLWLNVLKPAEILRQWQIAISMLIHQPTAVMVRSWIIDIAVRPYANFANAHRLCTVLMLVHESA